MHAPTEMNDFALVQTQSGKVKGQASVQVTPKSGKQVFKFTGIPFAKPPIGNFRFEPPQKNDCWEGILNATKLKPRPMQDPAIFNLIFGNMPLPNQCEDNMAGMSEDCLYLNVYTSNPFCTAEMPVLFWVYGGGFQIGSTAGYDGQVLCSLHDVVLVVAAYRVNIFGFFTTGKDTKYPGNMGIRDQLLALEWTRDNIRNFGGNPNNVTIFGESAGAMAVSCLMLSPLSKGLFHKSIQHSGTADMPLSVKKDNRSALKEHLEKLEIQETEPEEVVKKLKSLDASFIIDRCKKLFKSERFSVFVDGTFLPENPRKMMQGGCLANIPSVVGCNKTEYAGVLAYKQPPVFATGLSEEQWSEISKVTVPVFVESRVTPQKVADACRTVKNFYAEEFANTDKYKWSKVAAMMQADVFYVVPTIEQALAHSKTDQSTFLYNMTQRLMCYHDPAFQGDLKLKPEFCECDHTDDVLFTFGITLMEKVLDKNAKFTEEEKQMSKDWMTYIANFATSGNPNVGKAVKCEWSRFDGEKQRYLNARSDFVDESFLAPERFKLWSKTLPML